MNPDDVELLTPGKEKSMAIHELKTWPEFFGAIKDGRKAFDVRLNDRDFAVGDTLRLREYDPHTDSYLGRYVDAQVIYILPGGQFGIKAGYCVLGIDLIPDAQPITLRDEAALRIAAAMLTATSPDEELPNPEYIGRCGKPFKEMLGERAYAFADALVRAGKETT